MLVVLPALNEGPSVGTVVRDVRSRYPHYDVLVVDDGSTDDTATAAASAGALVCSLPFNLGVGGAMRTAYKFAARHGYQVVVQVDADGQHDPSYIEKLVDGLAEADLVIGARFAGVGDYRAALARRLAMRLLARVLSRLAKRPLTDVTSGFRAAGPRCIELFALHYPAEYLGDTVESLVIALRTGSTSTRSPLRCACARTATRRSRRSRPPSIWRARLRRSGSHWSGSGRCLRRSRKWSCPESQGAAS